MITDALRRSHHPARIGAAFTIAALAFIVLACTPPRDGTPATPQTTIAVLAVVITT
jgi:hypothetical protein